MKSESGEILMTVIMIAGAVIILTIYPLLSTAQRLDDATLLTVQSIVTDLTNDIAETRKNNAR